MVHQAQEHDTNIKNKRSYTNHTPFHHLINPHLLGSNKYPSILSHHLITSITNSKYKCLKFFIRYKNGHKLKLYKWNLNEYYIFDRINTYLIQWKRNYKKIKEIPKLIKVIWIFTPFWSSQLILIFLSPKTYYWFLHINNIRRTERNKVFVLINFSRNYVEFKSLVLCKVVWKQESWPF